jgi:subtilase family serine protease
MLFFLVDTTTATSKDVKGHPDVPALASGDSTTTQSTVTLFSDTSPGTYNIRACADYHKVVVESDENNHCAMATGTVTVQ